MTDLFEPNINETNTPIENVSTGPLVGWLDRFETSYEAQRRASSMFGIERAVNDVDNSQVAALRGQGVEAIPTLNGQGLDTAKFYEDGGDENSINKFKEYDTRIGALKKTYPDLNLKDSSEIWSNVKDAAQKAEQKNATQRTNTILGGFAGAMAAGIDPRTDPLNTVLLPIGGVGKTAVLRIATQAGVQGAGEAINQATGVQTERRLLGLDHGFVDGLERVGGAIAGGAAGQALGEAGVAAFKSAGRRWFSGKPGDELPPIPPPESPSGGIPPTGKGGVHTPDDIRAQALLDGRIAYDQLPRDINPYGNTRMGNTRGVLDIDHVTQRLEDWSGESPAFIDPKTTTAIPRDVEGRVNFSDDFTTRKMLGNSSVDEMARVTDPKTFDVYDKLAAQKTQLQNEIQSMVTSTPPVNPVEFQTVRAAVDDLTNRIGDLKEQRDAGGLSNRKANDLTKRIDQLSAERGINMQRINHVAGPDVAATRAHLIEVDNQMRDLALVVSRAYAHARGEWSLSQEYKNAVRDMVRTGDRAIKEPQAARPIPGEEPTPIAPYKQMLHDKAPILQQSDKVEAKMRPNSDAADYAAAIIKENSKIMDAALDSYRTNLSKILKEEDGEVTIGGTNLKLRLDDTAHVPHEEGTGGKQITVRELLEQNLETEEDLKATQTCST